MVLLEALAAARPALDPSPWTIDGDGHIEWTGPATGIVQQDGHTWVVATGHLDTTRFVRACRDRVNQELAWGDWVDDVEREGVEHVHMTRTDGAVTFTAEPVDGSEPASAWGTAPITGVTVHQQ